VTATVFAVTALVNAAQLLHPGILTDLERTPAGLHGDWWRTATSLFVQDGGVYGTVSNLVFLALIGTIAEQVLSRRRWLLYYLGIGLASEFVGYASQPTGGGNSIAICGLNGAVTFALWGNDARLPPASSQLLIIWCAALIATVSSSAHIPAIVLGVVAAALSRAGVARGVAVQRPAAFGVLATGIGLTAAENIHGPALLGAIVLAAVLTTVAAQPTEPTVSPPDRSPPA
jgi:membrane associated rhomboid family serine protease